MFNTKEMMLQWRYINSAIISIGLLLTTFICQPDVYAQQPLHTQVHIQQSQVSLQHLSKEIQMQTGYAIAYNASELNGSQLIKIQQGTYKLEDLLHRLRQQQIQYSISGKTIILKKKATATKKSSTTKNKKKTSKKNTSTKNNKQQSTNKNSGAQQVRQFVQTIIKPNKPTQLEYTPKPAKSNDYLIIDHSHIGIWGQRKDNHRSTFANNFILQSTVYTETYFPLNASLMLGYKGVFISGSKSLLADRQRMLIGAGLQLALHPSHYLHVQYQFGKVETQKSIQVSTPIFDDDSTASLMVVHAPIHLQSDVHIASLQYQYKLKNNWYIAAGIQWNQYRTSYLDFQTPKDFLHGFSESSIISSAAFLAIPSTALGHHTDFNWERHKHMQQFYSFHIGLHYKFF